MDIAAGLLCCDNIKPTESVSNSPLTFTPKTTFDYF